MEIRSKGITKTENSKVRIHYGEKVKELGLPSGWRLLGNLRTGELPSVRKGEMVGALEYPVGTPRLEEIARGKKTTMVIITRAAQSPPSA